MSIFSPILASCHLWGSIVISKRRIQRTLGLKPLPTTASLPSSFVWGPYALDMPPSLLQGVKQRGKYLSGELERRQASQVGQFELETLDSWVSLLLFLPV